MDRNFNKSLQLVLKSEGGFVNIKADPGGATNRGITISTFRRYINPNGSIEDLKNLTIEQAATCYREQYWNAVGGDQLPDGVDYATFDFAVNSGPGRAARYLQSVVGASMDGAVVPATLDAVAKMPVGVVIDRLCDARLAFLKSLGTWGTFGKGWSARVTSVRKEALLMTAQTAQPASPAPAPTPAAPSAPAKVPAAPVPPKPVAKHVGLGIGALAIGAALSRWWGDILAWIHHFL